MSAESQRLTRLVDLCDAIARAPSLEARLTCLLSGLSDEFGFDHSMVLVPDEQQRMVLLSSHGYPGGGTGAEVPIGQGAIGVCAQRKTPVPNNSLRRNENQLRAIQAQLHGAPLSRVALPGLVNVQSQAALPAVFEGSLMAVLYVEDSRPGRFFEDDVLSLRLVASHLAAILAQAEEEEEEASSAKARALAPGSDAPESMLVRYYAADDSVFFGDDYVIKSLPGRILYKMLREYLEQGRREFTKKALRLDPQLKLPAIRDNLDARLLLLRRRLEERFPFARIEPSGRGRITLSTTSSFRLELHPGA
jgi:adenylate cyclase